MTTFVGAREGRQAIAVALTLALFALALVGIRDGSAAADPTARASRTVTVTIPGFKYRPATVRISRGSRVRFSNTSGTAHTATRKGSFDTRRIRPGRAATVRFNRRGRFAYHCTIHPSMKGKVIVR